MSVRYGGVRRGCPGGYGRPKPATLPRYMRKASRVTRAARAFVLLVALGIVAALVLVVIR